jgi:hypothetical protein
MMMAARFRSVFWVAIASIAGLGCYLVTQYVAGERLALAKVERQVVRAQIAVRDLQTELGTRGSMAQLEQWNQDALALAAPKADQFVKGETELAMLTRPPVVGAPAGTGSASAPAQVAAVSYRAPAPAAAPATEADPDAAPAAQAPAVPALRQATYIRPTHDRVAEQPEKVSLLATGTLAELGRIASTERSRSRRGSQ